MCLTKSPRKISGLHFRTCLSVCSAVGDSTGERAALHPLLPLPPVGRAGQVLIQTLGFLVFFLNLWVLVWFVGLESQHVLWFLEFSCAKPGVGLDDACGSLPVQIL